MLETIDSPQRVGRAIALRAAITTLLDEYTVEEFLAAAADELDVLASDAVTNHCEYDAGCLLHATTALRRSLEAILASERGECPMAARYCTACEGLRFEVSGRCAACDATFKGE